MLIGALSIGPAPSRAHAGDSPAQFIRASVELTLYARPDDLSAVIGAIKRDEAFLAVAETLGPQGATWYLIKTNTGAVGWIKKTETGEAEKLQEFFKSRAITLPLETPREVLTPSPPSEPSGTIKVPVQITGASVAVPTTLNRRLQTFLALDTGATTTMISHRVAKSLGLRTDGQRIVVATANGHISLPLARLGSVKVGDAEVHNLTVTVHDLSPAAKVDGLLGLDFLKRFHVSLDSRSQLLILAPR
jgi:clan AA aspartic protease (TIGR02281 family)